MGAHMKTTLDIADSVFLELKRCARREKKTAREIVEMALQLFLKEKAEGKAKPFRLRRHSFRGKGLQAGLREGDWDTIRTLAYEGRGG